MKHFSRPLVLFLHRFTIRLQTNDADCGRHARPHKCGLLAEAFVKYVRSR
jgi:hypothetical protein